MPWPKAVIPESLESLCVLSVAKNLGKVEWHHSFVEDEGDPSYWLSPFDVLSPSMLASVIDAVRSADGTTREEEHLGLLISKKLEELDMKSFTDLKESTAFHLICLAALHHSPLKTLKFGLKKIRCHKLQDILPAFPNLQVLNVSGTGHLNDSFLSLVASSCPQLKSLDVSDCGRVTDVGMEGLCNSNQSSTGICSSLVKLNIGGTKVTRDGGRLALKHLVKLEELEWRPTVRVIVEMSQSGELRRTLALRSLTMDCWQYERNAFQDHCLTSVVKLCPLIVHVEIPRNYKPTSLDMRALLELDNLQLLVLRDASRISFNEDLLPILEKFGHKSLDYLDVWTIKEMRLGAFVENCSKLSSLIIGMVGRFIPSPQPLKLGKRYLPNLQILQICAPDENFRRIDIDSQPSASDLALLFTSAPGLIKFKLEALDNLSIRTFEQAIAQHGFPDLVKFEVTSSPNVTKDVVDLFLDLGNPLTKIKIERHKHWSDSWNDHLPVDYKTYPFWKEKVDRENLNVSIYYCECPP